LERSDLFSLWVQRLHQLQSGAWIMPPEPQLSIYCGAINPRAIGALMAERGPDAIVIYVFSGVIEQEAQVVKLAGECGGRFLAIANHPEAGTGDRLEMALSLLIYQRVDFLVESAREDQFAGLMDNFSLRLSQATMMRQGLYMTRLSKISARLINLALAGQRELLDPLAGPYPFPAVICGAGPSLPDNLEQLRPYRKKLFLIAVGHAFKTLMAAGIAPDLVVEIDSNARNNWHHDYDPGEIPLLAQVGVDPMIPARFRKVLWCGSRDLRERTWFQLTGTPLLELADGATVIIPAIDFAVKTGFSSLAVIGNDLCFSPSGAAHAGSSDTLTESRIPTPGWDRSVVESAPRFLQLRDCLEAYLKRLPAGTSIYNCSARGVVIRHMERLPFADWLAGHAANPRTAAVFRSMPSPRPSDWLRQKVTELDAYIRLTQKLSQWTISEEASIFPEQHAETQKLLDLEWRFAVHPEWAFQIGSLHRKTDDFLLAPVTMAERRDTAAAAWKNLRMRFRILFCLAVDFSRKLVASANLTPDRVEALAEAAYEQHTFSLIAALAVRRWHPAFGDFLAKMGPAACPPQFSYTCKWENYEQLWWHRPDGTRLLLDPPIQFDCSVRRDVSAILAEMCLEKHDGILFLAPFGWTYMVELMEQQPGRPLMVLEPYPQLLRSLFRYTSLILRLPWQAAIFGIDPELFPDHEILLLQHLTIWESQGIRPRLVIHPRAAEMAEVKAAATRIARLLASFGLPASDYGKPDLL